MSSVALAPSAVSRSAVNPWFVAVAVVIPTFMEVVDTTVANVALRYIAGGLSAAVIDSEWVITSYLAANAFVLPISGWLSAHFGRRRYFLLSIAVFTLASGLCGMATNLEQLILFRVLQGLAGGGLQPSSQAVLLDSFPREKQGAAMTMFAVAAIFGPIVGPTLGGWLVDTYEWRWIFYINLPVGVLGFLACYALLDDPDYLKQQRMDLKRRPLDFDGIGLGLLALVMASWEVMLSKGQEWDWLGDPFCAYRRCCWCSRWRSGACSFESCGLPARSSTSGCSGSATSRLPASLSSARSPCCTRRRWRRPLCSRRSSVTTPITRGWSSRRPVSSRS